MDQFEFSDGLLMSYTAKIALEVGGRLLMEYESKARDFKKEIGHSMLKAKRHQ